jgi:hypothetical protein
MHIVGVEMWDFSFSGYMDIVLGCGRYGIFSFNMHGYMDIVLGCGRYGLG